METGQFVESGMIVQYDHGLVLRVVQILRVVDMLTKPT